MGKAIVSVVLGYVVMAVAVFISFTVAYLVLGPDRAFRPGSYEISTLWAVVSIVLSFIAAKAGGFVCAAVAKAPTPPKVLAALVLTLGLLLAIPSLTRDAAPPTTRSGDVGNVEAMQGAQQPAWITLLTPFVGAIGVLVGSGLVKRNRTGTSME